MDVHGPRVVSLVPVASEARPNVGFGVLMSGLLLQFATKRSQPDSAALVALVASAPVHRVEDAPASAPAAPEYNGVVCLLCEIVLEQVETGLSSR